MAEHRSDMRSPLMDYAVPWSSRFLSSGCQRSLTEELKTSLLEILCCPRALWKEIDFESKNRSEVLGDSCKAVHRHKHAGNRVWKQQLWQEGNMEASDNGTADTVLFFWAITEERRVAFVSNYACTTVQILTARHSVTPEMHQTWVHTPGFESHPTQSW